jgi:hypothetical protein
MNSVLRISPRWTANTFFDLDVEGPILSNPRSLSQTAPVRFFLEAVDVLERAPGRSQPPDRDP